MNGTVRANIKKGVQVKIVLKKDQRIKVRLEDGQIGRVQEIIQ
jgi:uncharacterized protein YwbE